MYFSEISLTFLHFLWYFLSADQTPTPTRFLRNCEEVGLFGDLELNQASDEEDKETRQVGEVRWLAKNWEIIYIFILIIVWQQAD